MGLFNKKEKVPELPMAPRLPDIPKNEIEQKEISGLPSLPGNAGEGLNREMVKSAVQDDFDNNFDEDSSGKNEVVMESPQGDSHNRYMSPGGFGIPNPPPKNMQSSISEKENLKLSHLKQRIPRPPIPELQREKREMIFVRIDKFQEARKELDDIQKTVKQIESVLSKMKEIKSKEDSEISSLTDELESIKAKLDSIDSGVFNKA